MNATQTTIATLAAAAMLGSMALIQDAPQSAITAPASTNKLTVTFAPVGSTFTNFIWITTTNRWATNFGSYIYVTNTVTTVCEILALKPVTNYLVTLTPGTNAVQAATNTTSPYYAITSQPPAVVSPVPANTSYVATAWALLADGQKLYIGQTRFPRQPTNVLTLTAWLVSKTNLAVPDWKRVATLGEVSVTNPTGTATYYAAEMKETLTDYAPKALTITRNILQTPP